MKIDEHVEEENEIPKMITTGELEVGFKNLKSPDVNIEEVERTFGLNTKDWREDWGKAITSVKKNGYNIINH